MARAKELATAAVQERGDTAAAVLARCLIEDVPDAAALHTAVTVRLPALLEAHACEAPPDWPHPRHASLRVVVVDSIAACLRAEFDAASGRSVAVARAKYMYEVAAALKAAAAAWGVGVLVVNQVSAAGVGQDTDAAPRARAALGLVWSHCVSARLQLARKPPLGAVPLGAVPALLPPTAVAAAALAFRDHASGPPGARKRGREAAFPLQPVLLATPRDTPSASLSLGATVPAAALLDSEALDASALRHAAVCFAAWCAPAEALYAVTPEGVRGALLLQNG